MAGIEPAWWERESDKRNHRGVESLSRFLRSATLVRTVWQGSIRRHRLGIVSRCSGRISK